MRWIGLAAGLLVAHAPGFAQMAYTGRIEKLPIELVTDIYAEGPVHAIYMYTDFDTPIIVNGKLDHGVLTLIEQDPSGRNSATLTFSQFDSKSKKLVGTWKNLSTGKELPISLTRKFEIDIVQVRAEDREILQ